MPRRRFVLGGTVLLSVMLHAMGMARSPLPAQDGLKYLRVARAFQSESPILAIRGTDQHPLYPMAVALVQPVVAWGSGPGPDSWRVAAQGVSALASVLLLFPLHRLTRALFENSAADLGCFLYVLLPRPAAIGHDTLADPLALLACLTSLDCGWRALAGRDIRWAIGCGLAGGLGYWIRPEVLVAPLVVGLVGVVLAARRGFRGDLSNRWASDPLRAFGVVSVAALAMVGLYASAKGEVSEKLALRRWAGMAPSSSPKPVASRPVRDGLEDRHWDFSAKAEEGPPARWTVRDAAGAMVDAWAEGLGWLLAPFVFWGMVRARRYEGSSLAVVVCGIYALVFVGILLRHATGLGYLSARHCLSLVVLGIPWAAAGILTCARRLAGWLPLGIGRGLGVSALMVMLIVGVGMQWKEAHASRLGHREAGRWLADHCGTDEGILDTRGWAAFLSGRSRVYDPWHIRQALRDDRLAYLVVGSDELLGESRRAETLRALVDFAFSGGPIASFAGRLGERDDSVEVYRFRRPTSWEGFRP